MVGSHGCDGGMGALHDATWVRGVFPVSYKKASSCPTESYKIQPGSVQDYGRRVQMTAAACLSCPNTVQAEAIGEAMTLEQQLTFGPFRLDVRAGRLWRGAQGIPLRPRAVAMLRYLVEHPGRLVTKAELRQQVWAGTHVTDTVLRVCVREIRAALCDAAAAPQYVATVGQQGYRFLGGGNLESAPMLTPGPLVGRQHEAERLEGWFQRAASGQRQLGFVSGE